MDVRLKREIERGTLPRQLVVCGPAGTGKTYGILTVIHLLAVNYPGLRILFFRKTRRALTESVMVTFEQEVLARDGMASIAAGAQRKNRSNYLYPNGTEIVLAGLDEPTRIASTAWDLAFGNEMIEVDEAGWDTVVSRLNRPGRDRRFGFLVGDTNPGDPSHWARARAVAGTLAMWDTAHAANPRMHDGRAWTPEGRRYLDRSLGSLRGTRRKRLLEGLWAAGEGQWFESFGEAHVSEAAAFDPRLPVHLAVDTGVHTGAVLFQVAGPRVSVFGDYYAFDLPAHENARAVLARFAGLCGRPPVPRHDRLTSDPAGRASNPVGPTVLGEYARAGLALDPWPNYPGSVADGLALVESFVSVDPPGMFVHPRCSRLIGAFANYRRMKRAGQFVDRPEDPQHPHEDLMDALRGGLMDRFPDGRRPAPRLLTVPARNVF